MKKNPLCAESGKICYSRKEAGIKLNDAKRFHGSRTKQLPKRMYWCEHCGFYHLTHYKTYWKTYKRRLK